MVSNPMLLLPLYIWPGPPSTPAWTPLYTTIPTTPNLTYTLIINPSTGPGTAIYPDAAYIAALTTLHAHPNVQTLGYVATSHGQRALAGVQADIDAYAAWAGLPAAEGDIALDGVFFDEAPASVQGLGYMQAAAAYARGAIGGNGMSGGNSNSSNQSCYVVFNPGVPVDAAFARAADSVVMFENSAANFSATSLSNIPASVAANASVLVHGFGGDAAVQGELVEQIAAAGVGGVYVTTANDYHSFSALWGSLAAQVADPDGSGTSTQTTGTGSAVASSAVQSAASSASGGGGAATSTTTTASTAGARAKSAAMGRADGLWVWRWMTTVAGMGRIATRHGVAAVGREL